MSKYTKPEINVMTIEAGDIIQTSGLVDGGTGGGKGTIHYPEPNATTMSVFEN